MFSALISKLDCFLVPIEPHLFYLRFSTGCYFSPNPFCLCLCILLHFIFFLVHFHFSSIFLEVTLPKEIIFFLSFLWRSHLCSEGLMFLETTKPLRKDGIDVSHCRVYVNVYHLCDDPTIISVLITRSSRRVGRGGRNSHPQMFFLSTKWRSALLINSLTDISLPRFHWAVQCGILGVIVNWTH